MARMARVVVPYYPHHVTQRGNRRQRTFFCDDDYATYLKLLSQSRTGRPLGDARFVQTLERITGRVLAHRRPGRKKKAMKK